MTTLFNQISVTTKTINQIEEGFERGDEYTNTQVHASILNKEARDHILIKSQHITIKQ